MNILIASDLHLSRKPWPVRKALKKGQDADLVLLTGDLTNDGTAPQFSLLAQCIADILADTPVFSTAGNHDFPAPCVEFDRVRQNLYINSGSIRPTTLLDAQGKPIGTSAPGNVVRLELTEQGLSLQTIGLPDESVLQTRQPGFFPSVP